MMHLFNWKKGVAMRSRPGMMGMGWVLGLAAVLAAGGPLQAQEAAKAGAAPNIVNIVNFIRGIEPRGSMDLMQPVVEQLKLGKKHKLPTTYLIQYDALIKPEFVDLLKKEMAPEDEIGVWLEVVQPQVEAAGLKWRGRYPWDWHTDVGFTQGYAVEDRIKVIDVLMEKFKQVFGKYPRSVGNWIIDAPTLNHLYDKYHIVAACNCKDQSGTDGYTLWGGYWNQAYYPSRLNAYMPAQTAAQQLNVPVFRMLGSDPVTQYSHGSQVITLEPVYGHAGGDPKWVSWFFDTNFNHPSLAFSYMQAGQENSFGWPAMSKGLIDQYQKLDDLAKQGKVRVETMEKSGTWFRKNFERTPASSIVALDDAAGKGERSIWYESRFYRTNLYWEGDTWRIRDLHLFDESYQERYLTKAVTTPTATYDTLPVMDGYHWGTPDQAAGIRGLLDGKPFSIVGTPVVTQTGKESLLITSKLAGGGEMKIHCEPASLSIELPETPAWSLEMMWAAGKKPPVTAVGPKDIGYQHNGWAYTLHCGGSAISRGARENAVTIQPVGKTVTFNFDPSASSAYRELDGRTTGSTWDAASPVWKSHEDGTGAGIAWPGPDFTAVFSAPKNAAPSTLGIAGEVKAGGVVVKSGRLILDGGAIELKHPSLLRVETGAGLVLNTPLTGTSGLLIAGGGMTGLKDAIGVTGNLTLGDGARVSAEGAKLTVEGDVEVNGASFATSSSTVLQAGNLKVNSGQGASLVSLGGDSQFKLRAQEGVVSLESGAVKLADSAVLEAHRFANRGSGSNQTLEVSGRAKLLLDEALVLGDNSAAKVTVNQSGGTVGNTGGDNRPEAGQLSNRWGHWPSADTIYNINAGTLDLSGAPLYLSWDSAAALNISGTAVVTLKGIEMGWRGRSSDSTVNLRGGELKIGPDGITNGGSGAKVVKLEGGKLSSTAAWGTTVPVALAGPVAVDTSGGDITLGGGLTGKGVLAKSGGGLLELAGWTTFDGVAEVKEGVLRVGDAPDTAVRVSSGGAIAIAPHGSQAVNLKALELARGSSSEFTIGTSATSLVISHGGGLRVLGSHTIHLKSGPGAAPGTFTLIRYTGTIGGAGFTNLMLGTTPGLKARLVNNTAASSIDLQVTEVEPPPSE